MRGKAILLGALTLLLAGCATVGPGPGSGVNANATLQTAEAAYASGNFEDALLNYEIVLAVKPALIRNTKSSQILGNYYDTQIRVGAARAQASESKGDLVGAWVYYVQTSLVNPDRRECKDAAQAAARVKSALADLSLAQSRAALAANDCTAAALAACQSLWYGGGEPARAVLTKAFAGPKSTAHAVGHQPPPRIRHSRSRAHRQLATPEKRPHLRTLRCARVPRKSPPLLGVHGRHKSGRLPANRARPRRRRIWRCAHGTQRSRQTTRRGRHHQRPPRIQTQTLLHHRRTRPLRKHPKPSQRNAHGQRPLQERAACRQHKVSPTCL